MARDDLVDGRTEGLCDRRTVLLAVIGCASVLHGVGVAGMVIPMAPEPVGSGARALGQSAFIAVADDATAASWNPAGLINLEEPEASFVGIGRTIADDRSSNSTDFTWGDNSWDVGEINFMSYAQPFSLGNNDVVLSVNYHQVYDLSMEFDRESASGERISGRWKGAISAYSFAGAIAMPSVPEVTIGASLNWYTRSLLNSCVLHGTNDEWSISEQDPNEPPRLSSTTETLSDLRGYNFTVGLLWDVYERQERLLTLGFVCHTPFTADVDHETKVDGQSMDIPDPQLHLDFPISLGAGLHCRLSSRFSTTFDVQWTDWSEFSPEHTGSTSGPSDAVAYRLGMECLTFPRSLRKSVLTYRGGIFYEPRPAWDDILPVYGFSLGLGWTLQERFSMDFAYQFRSGEKNLGTFDYEIQEHWLIGSVIVYF